MLELLKIQGLGPKTIALIWSAFQVSDLAGVEQLAREGKLRELPRLSEKSEQKILKAIEDYRRISGRFLLDEADRTAQKLTEHLKHIKGIEKITPAGSLRRGRETVGDLDVLITGPCCVDDEQRAELIEEILRFPGILEVLAKGDNKVSFKLRSGMQVDVRTLPPDSYGAAHAILHRLQEPQRDAAPARAEDGLTLNEYGLFRLEDNQRVAGTTEDEIYGKLKLDCIPPELRENCGEIEAAAEAHAAQPDHRGRYSRRSAHAHRRNRRTMHHRRDGARPRKNAATSTSPSPITPRTWPSPTDLTTSGRWNTSRASAPPTTRSRALPIMAGIEVDILADGELDLSDSVLEQMDVVVASVHSAFNQEPQQMTDRLLRALSNQNVSILGIRQDACCCDATPIRSTWTPSEAALQTTLRWS